MQGNICWVGCENLDLNFEPKLSLTKADVSGQLYPNVSR